MLVHYLTLRAISAELYSLLSGAVIREVYTQNRDELTIACEAAGTERSLSISVDPALNFICSRNSASRAKRNTADLFPAFLGRTIRAIALAGFDRIVKVSTDDPDLTLFAQLYNTSSSNIVLADSSLIITGAFKNSARLVGQSFDLHDGRFDSNIFINIERFQDEIARNGEEPIGKRLKTLLPIFGSTYVREILFRVGIEEDRPSSACATSEIEQIFHEVVAVLAECDSTHPVIYSDGDAPKLLSPIPLRHISDLSARSFESVNDAVKFCIGKLHHRREESDERKTITDKLRAMLEHTRKSLDAAHRQSRESDRAAEYERTGSILMSNLSQLSKGMNSVVLADNIGGSGTMKITLDPKLPPARNAERYFDKAKNAKVAAKESEERMGSLGAQVSALEKLSLELDRTGTQAQFEEFIESHRAQLDALHLIPGKKGEKELPPFRVFTVAGGAEVWVGKSSANNDLLTMKYAKPNDLWFHARGSSGSHTVLRVPDPSRPPGKEAIYATASIAAYYSKMRNGKNVPVAYCEKKYVRKPKGAAVGAVTLEREKVIFVNPKLPE